MQCGGSRARLPPVDLQLPVCAARTESAIVADHPARRERPGGEPGPDPSHPVTPAELRDWGDAIVASLLSGRAGQGLHPHFAIASLDALVAVIREQGVDLSRHCAGPWRVEPLARPGANRGGAFDRPGHAVVRCGRFAIRVVPPADPHLTAGALNWCGVSPPLLAN